MEEKKENQFIKEEERKMQSKKIKSISIWSSQTLKPMMKFIEEEIKGIRIDRIKNNIYSFNGEFLTPATYDDLVLILNINKLDKSKREEILKPNFNLYKVGLEYDDTTYAEFQSGISDCTHCEKYLTGVRESLETNELVIFVNTKKTAEVVM